PQLPLGLGPNTQRTKSDTQFEASACRPGGQGGFRKSLGARIAPETPDSGVPRQQTVIEKSPISAEGVRLVGCWRDPGGTLISRSSGRVRRPGHPSRDYALRGGSPFLRNHAPAGSHPAASSRRIKFSDSTSLTYARPFTI